jgi:hypothetical protein
MMCFPKPDLSQIVLSQFNYFQIIFRVSGSSFGHMSLLLQREDTGTILGISEAVLLSIPVIQTQFGKCGSLVKRNVL